MCDSQGISITEFRYCHGKSVVVEWACYTRIQIPSEQIILHFFSDPILIDELKNLVSINKSLQQDPVIPTVGLIVLIGVTFMLYRTQPPHRFEKKYPGSIPLEEV